MLDSIPGTLMLTDCLEQCQSNDSCSSVNYETGLCILFSSNADKLPGKFFVGIIMEQWILHDHSSTEDAQTISWEPCFHVFMD